MQNYCVTYFIGNLTAKPRYRLVKGNRPVCDGTIAVDATFKRNDEWVEETTYIDITAFGALAEALKDVSKGTALFCEGRLKSDVFTEKDTSKRRYKLKVIANRLSRIPGKDAGSTKSITSTTQPAA